MAVVKKVFNPPPRNWSKAVKVITDPANSLSLTGDQVFPMRGYYSVIMSNHTSHIVRVDNRQCDEHGSSCNAVRAVVMYLVNGGQRADRLDEQRMIPEVCPVCGGKVRHEPRLSSKVRGDGWVCCKLAEEQGTVDAFTIAGARHYWLSQKLGE